MHVGNRTDGLLCHSDYCLIKGDVQEVLQCNWRRRAVVVPIEKIGDAIQSPGHVPRVQEEGSE